MSNHVHVARLLNPFNICKYQKKTYVVYNPTYDLLYRSHAFKEDIKEKNKFGDWKTDEQNKMYLVSKHLILPNVDQDIEKARKRIDAFKLNLYTARVNPSHLKKNTARIKNATEQLSKLFNIRYSLDHLTLEYFAEKERFIYLLKNSVYDLEEKKLDLDYLLTQSLSMLHASSGLGYDKLREIARTEPWTIYWSMHKTKIFNFVDKYDLSSEQKHIFYISQMLDSIQTVDNPPHQSIIDNDWMLDGWKLNRIKENELAEREANSGRPAPRGQEVYIPVDSQEDADFVNNMNSPESNFTKKRREVAIKKGGSVSESQLPDKQDHIRTMINQQKGKGN